MNSRSPRGISHQGLDAAFEAEETRKSNLILQARLLREQCQDEMAVAKFAQAAEIEETLSGICSQHGLLDKSFVHLYSAASCWAQAGDFYHAIAICDSMLARADLPDRLREDVGDYAAALRRRRSEWYQRVVLESARTES